MWGSNVPVRTVFHVHQASVTMGQPQLSYCVTQTEHLSGNKQFSAIISSDIYKNSGTFRDTQDREDILNTTAPHTPLSLGGHWLGPLQIAVFLLMSQ